MDDSRLRRDLLELLEGKSAHVGADAAFADLAPEHRAARPLEDGHTIWELLEHLRIAQEDILRYTLDPGWTSPDWPDGYWPDIETPTEEQWQASLEQFRRDLEGVKELVRDPDRDLTADIPHGEGRSSLREVLLVADHNAYHLGQVLEIRRLLGAWT
jgi:uncharacterized damage-inducible protein DinB